MKPTSLRYALLISAALICSAPLHAEEALTRATGAPVGDNQNSLTAGPNGPTLLEDNYLIEKLGSFDRERIPERVVHARGTGAFGEFKSTADLSGITRAAPFQKAGKATPVFVRFSTVIHSKGSPETLRDPHGFAVKFYTDEGNWDLVGNNLPIFFIRDAIKFPDMIHSLKPDPVTNIQDPNRVFDFFSHIPESTQMLTRVYTTLGIPLSYRMMDGAGVHAFKFTTKDCKWEYVKFTWKTRQGVKGLSVAEASAMQAKDFNHLTHDLYTEIGKKNFPVWDLYIQEMKPEELTKFDFNPLDDTKVWPENLVPMRKVGELTLNKVPENFFQSTEEVAMAPSNLIPGIEPSEDRMLQGRLFSYADTQRYRLGVNGIHLPINESRVKTHNHEQDGAGWSPERTGSVNYQPSETGTGYTDNAANDQCRYPLSGTTQQEIIAKTQNFKQAGDFYRSLPEEEKVKLIDGLNSDLGQVKSTNIRLTMTSYFYKADSDYGTRVAEAVKVDLAEVKKRAAALKD